MQVGTFVIFLVKERVSKSKHLQFVSGVNAINYWFATFLYDFVCYLLPSLVILGVFAVFDIEPFLEGGNFL